MKNYLYFLIAFVLSAAAFGRLEVSRQVLFEGGTQGYSTYRIPGLVATTKDGTIHLLYEGGILKGCPSDAANNAMTLVSFNLEWFTEGDDSLDHSDQPLNQLFEPSLWRA